jgi:hypothetical protein
VSGPTAAEVAGLRSVWIAAHQAVDEAGDDDWDMVIDALDFYEAARDALRANA